MNKKTILLTIATLLTISTVSGAQITPTNPGNQTIEPGEEFTQEFDISFEENDTEVRVTASDTGEYDVGYNSFRIFNGDGTFSADIQAPNDVSNYTYDVQFTFQVQRENQSDQEITRSVETYTKIPYITLQEPTWINRSKQLEFNGDKYNISEIGDNLYFNNNSVRVPYQDTTTVNNVRLKLHDIIPGEYAKISADTQAENIQFQINQLDTGKVEDPDACTLGIKTITTMRRGSSFAIETINTESSSNEIIPGVSVTLIDTGTGEPIGNTESGGSGYASIYIKDDVQGPVVARLAKPSGNCVSSNANINFNTPYNTYIEENNEFQLQLQNVNTTVYEHITGIVKDKSGGEVSTGLIAITRPDGTTTDIAFNKTGFKFTPDQSGTYTIKATKENYVASNEIQVEYIPDQDGDGIPNNQDNCQTVKGVEANNGCPQIDGQITAYRNGEKIFTLRPNTEYNFQIENENGTLIKYTGNATVEGESSKTLRFKKGVSRHENGTTISFPSEGSVTMTVDDQKFDNLEQTFTVEKKPFLQGVPVAPIGGAALLLIAFAGYLLFSRSESSSSSSGEEYTYDQNFLDIDEEVDE